MQARGEGDATQKIAVGAWAQYERRMLDRVCEKKNARQGVGDQGFKTEVGTDGSEVYARHIRCIRCMSQVYQHLRTRFLHPRDPGAQA